jgi:D-3-phosphoglycerate dehydrogenase
VDKTVNSVKVVMTQPLGSEGMNLFRGMKIFVANDADPHHYLHELEDAEVLIVRIASITRDIIDGCHKLKVIGRPGVGYENIDVEAATERGIPVVLTPGANTRSVAEHTIAMILALAKNLLESHLETLKGNFMAIRGTGKSFELNGKTAGLIGLGAIGRETAALCRALGMKTIAYDPPLSREKIEAQGCAYCADLDELLISADIITIHIPLLPETKNLIGLEQMKKMKPSALLINCARGGIVNEDDLFTALNEHTLAGAALDTFAEEPVPADAKILSAPSLLVSPHSAAQTREAVARMGSMCAEGCLAVLRGERWPYTAK